MQHKYDVILFNNTIFLFCQAVLDYANEKNGPGAE